MFSRVAYLPLVVTILALVLSAGADPIPFFRNTKYNEIQVLPSAQVALLAPLYNSALAQRKHKLALRVFFTGQDQTAIYPGARTATRGTNIGNWLASILGKLVLPNQKKHRMGQ